MTEFQEQKLLEYNTILRACYGKRQMLNAISALLPKKLSRDAVRKKIVHLTEIGLLTVHNKCWYESKAKEYPFDMYLAYLDEKQKKQSSAAYKKHEDGQLRAMNENKTSLGDAVYVHRMELYADKYHRQAKESQADRKSPRVYVGNLWEMMV